MAQGVASQVVGQAIFVIARVHKPGKGQLPCVVEADRPIASIPGFGHSRENQPGQNSNDGDNNQQLDKSESWSLMQRAIAKT